MEALMFLVLLFFVIGVPLMIFGSISGAGKVRVVREEVIEDEDNDLIQ